jgi:flavodoxin
MAGSQRPVRGRSALVLFGSETGNAQDAAEEVGNICERLRFATHLYELNSIDIVSLALRN